MQRGGRSESMVPPKVRLKAWPFAPGAPSAHGSSHLSSFGEAQPLGALRLPRRCLRAVEDVPSERVSSWQRGMIEVARGVVSHAQLGHDAT